MRRTLPPLWLARPSRFAGLERRYAQLGLALLALLLCASLLALTITPDATPRLAEHPDIALYQTIIDGVRHGGHYYQVSADALRAGDYPLKPFVTFRLPTLAIVIAALPEWATGLMLWALAAAAALAWYRRLVPAFRNAPPRLVAFALVVSGVAIHIHRDLAGFHEIWAGLLIALSLALWRPDRWIEPIAFGLAAALIRETAAVYLIVMAALALAERRPRELIGWSLALGILTVVLAFHAHAVAGVVRPLDPWLPGWEGMPGFGFFVHLMVVSTALAALPATVAALLVGLALFGWAAWADPLGTRVAAVLAAYALLLATVGRLDAFYWGLLIAPLVPLGLVFALDGTRDLLGGALDRRRITVRRIAP